MTLQLRFSLSFCVARTTILQPKNTLKMTRQQTKKAPNSKKSSSSKNQNRFEKGVAEEANLQDNLTQLKLVASSEASKASKEAEIVSQLQDDEMLDDNDSRESLRQLGIDTVIDKLFAARKARNKFARKTRSRAKMNCNNVANLSTKIQKYIKQERILKDQVEFLFKKCKQHGIKVDLDKFRAEIKEKQTEREFFNDQIFM